MPQPDEESVKIVFAGLFNFAAIDINMVDPEKFVLLQHIEIEPQRSYIHLEVLRIFFKGNNDPRFTKLHGTPYDAFNGKQGFAGAGAATNEGGTSDWEAPAGNFIETADARRGFFELLINKPCPSFLSHFYNYWLEVPLAHIQKLLIYSILPTAMAIRRI